MSEITHDYPACAVYRGGKCTCDAVPTMGRVKINNQDYWREVIRVAVITVDGTSCVVPFKDLVDMVEGGGQYTIEVKTMGKAQFEKLPEFNGW